MCNFEGRQGRMAKMDPGVGTTINHPTAAAHIIESSKAAEHHKETSWSLIRAKGHTGMSQDLGVTAKKSICLKRRKRHDT